MTHEGMNVGFQGKQERSMELVRRAEAQRKGENAQAILRKVLGEFPRAFVAVDERALVLRTDPNPDCAVYVHVTREECEFLRNFM